MPATELEAPSHGVSKHTVMGWTICLVGSFFYLYEYLLRVTPSQMTASLQQAFHINAATLGNLTAYYYYIYAPMQLFVGVLMDRYGPRRLLTLAAFCCAIGTFLFSDNYSLPMAEFGRFLVGFGSAFAFVGVLKLATIFLPSRVFALVSGLTMALGMVGGMVGDLLISNLVAHEGWKLTLYVAATVGFVLNLIIFLVVRDSPSKGEAFVSSVPSIRSAFDGLLGLLCKPAIWVNGVVGCLLYLPTSTFAEFWGTPYLEQAYGLSRQSAALGMFFIFAGWASGGPLVGYISDRIKQRRLPMTIGSMVAAVLFSAVLYIPNFPVFLLYPTFYVFGLFSSVQVIVFALGRELSSPRFSGTVISLTNMFVMSGGAVTLSLVGKLLDSYWSGEVAQGLHIYSVGNFQYALSVLPIGLLLSVVLTFFLPETHARMQVDVTHQS